MSRMNRNEYKVARQIIRENGYYALRWLTKESAEVMDSLRNIKAATDPLAERAWFADWCKRNNRECSIRQLRQLAHVD